MARMGFWRMKLVPLLTATRRTRVRLCRHCCRQLHGIGHGVLQQAPGFRLGTYRGIEPTWCSDPLNDFCIRRHSQKLVNLGDQAHS